MIEQLRTYRFTIKQIFKEHWPDYLSRHKDSLRRDVIRTVEKMLSCRDPEKLGYINMPARSTLMSTLSFLIPAKLASAIPVVRFLPIGG
ncbi:transposase zinc-binding domain-containing protein [Dehalococcoidia bacterium]|nr:transposase zinc-binding domain-containing protein [Dehalococcoidia bacterium]